MNFDKKFKILAVLGLVIISSILVGSIIGDENDAVKTIEENFETKTLKKSDYWTNFTYIHVKNNWSDFGSWLKGDGSWSNPYKIENMTIDATGTPTGSGILIENSNNTYFEIRNCTISNWGAGAYDGAIHILNSSDGYLEQNDCSGGGNGIVLNGDLTGTCENITIFNNTIDSNTVRGIRITDYASGNRVLSNRIRGNNYGVVCFDHATNNTIKNNNITGNNRGIHIQTLSDQNVIKFNNISNNGYGIYIWDQCDDNDILNNLIKDNTNAGIYLFDTNDLNYIANNNITHGSNRGIHLDDNCDYNIIQNNNISYNGLLGIHVELSCTYNNIKSNTINYNFGTMFNNAGILLDNSVAFNNITLNTIIGNDYFGIRLLGGNTNLVNNNTIVGDHYTGIEIYGSLSNTIINNTISLSTSEGIWVHQATTGNIIVNNTIDNNQWGIHLENNADTTDITENLIINNTLRGIYIETTDCENNEVWLNNFINNTINAQGSSDPGDNSWDKGGVGNYWDDYGGTDANDDGIGDVPYSIFGSAGSQDNYPIWDSTFPNITIINPKPNQLFGAQAPYFNVEIRDRNLHKMWYTIDNGLNNYTFISNESIYQPAWALESNGTVTIIFYAIDTFGHISFKEVTVRKDILAPILTIVNPLNNDIRAKTNRTFNFIIVEGNLDTMWYSIAEGQNHTFTVSGSLDQADWDTAWDATPRDGAFLVRFYANDTVGNIISIDVWIKTNKQAPAKIPFGHMYFIIIGISTIALIVINKRKLNQK